MKLQTAMALADETCLDSICVGVGTYDLPWCCFNCGLKFWARFSKGHEAHRVECPLCGVRGGAKR